MLLAKSNKQNFHTYFRDGQNSVGVERVPNQFILQLPVKGYQWCKVLALLFVYNCDLVNLMTAIFIININSCVKDYCTLQTE